MFLIIFILLFTKSNLIREENMAEYQILNLMQVGFIQNVMYFECFHQNCRYHLRKFTHCGVEPIWRRHGRGRNVISS